MSIKTLFAGNYTLNIRFDTNMAGLNISNARFENVL